MLTGISEITKSESEKGLVLKNLCHFVGNTRHDDELGEFKGRKLQIHEDEMKGKAVC